MQDWNLADQTAGLENARLENAGLENAGLENAGLESDELRLKQRQTSSTIDVSELSQNCVSGLLCTSKTVLHEIVMLINATEHCQTFYIRTHS